MNSFTRSYNMYTQTFQWKLEQNIQQNSKFEEILISCSYLNILLNINTHWIIKNEYVLLKLVFSWMVAT